MVKQSIRLILFVIAISLFFGCSASRIYKPKGLEVIGDYYHKSTMIEFPENFNGFKRENITSFNKDSSNIGVSYIHDNSNHDIKFTVYIYPAPSSIEHRIRDEYFDCLQAIATNSNQWLNTTPKHVRVSKEGYKVLGLSATMNTSNLKTVLVLFECGKFFLKYRISSSAIDTSVLKGISDALIDKFSPVEIVKKQPLLLGVDVHISPAITTDTVCLHAIIAAAMTKIDWVYENVDSLERISGFPSLYFEEQKASIDSMLVIWESLKHNNTKFDMFFDDLVVIKKSGFLNEFIYDQFQGTLLLPDNVKLDWDNYEIWKGKNNPTVKLVDQYYYVLGFERSYKETKN